MKTILFESSFKSRNLKTRKFIVSLIRYEDDLSYVVSVDTIKDKKRLGIERLESPSFKVAFENFYVCIVRYCGVTIQHFGN